MSTPPHALVVEDTEEFVQVGRRLLQGEGYQVYVAGDGLTAVTMARATAPELVLLDVGLPELDGVEVCRRLREFSDAYVIMLTSRDSEVDRILGLGAGADDYVTKPFSVAELTLRVKAMRRRPRARVDAVRDFSDLVINPVSREVWLNDEPIELTRTEFDLLDALSASPRRTFSRQQLMESVWGRDWYGDDHLIDVHLGNLRRKLGESGTESRHLRTLRGVGYRFDP